MKPKDDELLWATAAHEAGHAVMRWLVGWPCTALTANYGDGFCAGTDRPVAIRDSLMITLAGHAAESGYGLSQPDLSIGDSGDLDEARQMLGETEWLRMAPTLPPNPVIGECGPMRLQSVDEALDLYFKDACACLRPHLFFIEELSTRLADERTLSARTVAAMCREYAKALKVTVAELVG